MAIKDRKPAESMFRRYILYSCVALLPLKIWSLVKTRTKAATMAQIDYTLFEPTHLKGQTNKRRIRFLCPHPISMSHSTLRLHCGGWVRGSPFGFTACYAHTSRGYQPAAAAQLKVVGDIPS